MSWQAPVYDRSESDLNTAKTIINKVNSDGYDSLEQAEKTLFDAGLKACRNYTDLNRIENNCDYLAEALDISLDTDTTWTASKTPLEDDILRIRDNVDTIRTTMYNIFPIDTPETPNLPINTIEKMNDLEQILFDVNSVYLNLMTWSDVDTLDETWSELDAKQLVWQEYYLKEV